MLPGLVESWGVPADTPKIACPIGPKKSSILDRRLFELGPTVANYDLTGTKRFRSLSLTSWKKSNIR